MAKNKEFKFKPMFKTHAIRTVLYGVLAILSSVIMKSPLLSLLFFSAFAVIAIINGVLTLADLNNPLWYEQLMSDEDDEDTDLSEENK